MEIAKITSKGQLTIPKEVRRSLGLRAGDKVLFVERDGGFLLLNNTAVCVQAVNLNSVSATLAIEGIETTEEMLNYARMRIAGETTYEKKLAEIAARYKNV
ncbi:MAG: AbrB/MazE/SpoVT family DNA-binding domain-containing protein [Roseburia sp.]|nr:AbrB/MazE/SpoVT family DNA-binding domain-containing protein [Roseburia sp.]